MFEAGTLHIAPPHTAASQRPDRLAVRGAAAAWLGAGGVLLLVELWTQHSGLDLAWGLPLALLVLAALAAVVPLERVPRAGQAVGAWAAIVLALGAETGLRMRAVDVATLLALPLAWLALRHDGSALVVGMVLALAGCCVALVVAGDPYVAVATLAAVGAAAAIRTLSGHGADQARFASVAYTDFLTTCPNRRALYTELPVRLQAAARREAPLAVAVIDLDRFSAFNEDWGHAAGDRLLTDVATVLRFTQRSDPDAPGLAYLARVGNDEFAMVLEGLTTHEVAELVRDIEGDLPAGCTVSVGIAFWDRREPADDLMNRALRALAAAGRAMGGGRVVVDEGAGSRAGSWLESVPALVARREIESVYQPIRDLTNGRLIGYEALARPTGAPTDTEVEGMFHAARRLGVSRELETLCQVSAMSGAHRLLARGGSLFINISVGAFTDPDRDLEVILGHLADAALKPTQIVLEVNEQITRFGRFAEACARYRRAGFRFAMDDVGEGLSTIEAIAVVRPEFIKVAKSLVVTAEDGGSAAVIRGLVEVARSLGGEIIAEGLETPEDCARMLGLGAALGQGWALGIPRRLRDVLAAGQGETAGRRARPHPEPPGLSVPALVPIRPV
ncbi:MAG: EAL domain-containing protein [Candidatus Dormibacteria bacterium]